VPETFTSEEHKNTKQRLKHIRDHFDELDEGSQDWAVKMEVAYEKQGWLSPRQLEIVDSIWEEV
jgi:ribosomal protein L16/L10AE